MRNVLCDNEPMIVLLRLGVMDAKMNWACLLCKRVHKTSELMDEHLKSERHLAAEAAARLKGRVTAAPNSIKRSWQTFARLIDLWWTQLADRFARTAFVRAAAVSLADTYLTLTADRSWHLNTSNMSRAHTRAMSHVQAFTFPHAQSCAATPRRWRPVCLGRRTLL